VESTLLLLNRQVNDVSALFNLSYKGIRVGRDVYYAGIRNRLVGTLGAIDAEVISLLREYIRNLCVTEMLIQMFNPECLLISDNCYASFSPFFHGFIQRHIPVVLSVCFASGSGKIGGKIYTSGKDIESTKRRYVFAFDDATWNVIQQTYSDEDDKAVQRYLEMRFSGNDLTYNGDYHKYTNKLSIDSIMKQIGLTKQSNRTVLVAAHLLWDDPGYDGLYPDYELWLKDTLLTIAKSKEVTWIVKAHPSENHMGARKTARQVVWDIFGSMLPEHIFFLDSDTSINTYSLIDFAEAVLTVRGTIGFEAACKGKHVISAGDGPFTGLGFAKEFDCQNDYRNYLLNLHQEKIWLCNEQIRNARMALFGYFIMKTPVSSILLRGDDISMYADLKARELNGDLALNRFAEKILSMSNGDLL
jgi:hypothetical protein